MTEFLQKLRVFDLEIWIQMFSAKRQEDNCTGRYMEELKNQNGEHLVSLWESDNLETQVISPITTSDY